MNNAARAPPPRPSCLSRSFFAPPPAAAGLVPIRDQFSVRPFNVQCSVHVYSVFREETGREVCSD